MADAMQNVAACLEAVKDVVPQMDTAVVDFASSLIIGNVPKVPKAIMVDLSVILSTFQAHLNETVTVCDSLNRAILPAHQATESLMMTAETAQDKKKKGESIEQKHLRRTVRTWLASLEDCSEEKLTAGMTALSELKNKWLKLAELIRDCNTKVQDYGEELRQTIKRLDNARWWCMVGAGVCIAAGIAASVGVMIASGGAAAPAEIAGIALSLGGAAAATATTGAAGAAAALASCGSIAGAAATAARKIMSNVNEQQKNYEEAATLIEQLAGTLEELKRGCHEMALKAENAASVVGKAKKYQEKVKRTIAGKSKPELEAVLEDLSEMSDKELSNFLKELGECKEQYEVMQSRLDALVAKGFELKKKHLQKDGLAYMKDELESKISKMQ